MLRYSALAVLGTVMIASAMAMAEPLSAIGGDLDGPGLSIEIDFEKCNESGHHIAVTRQDDHMIVHYHLRVRNGAGQTIYARQRTAWDNQGDDGEAMSVYKKKITSNNDLLSVYLRFPLHDDAALQNATIYQAEVGVYNAQEPNEYAIPDAAFAWRMKRDGDRLTPTKEQAGLPRTQRNFTVVGNSLRIERSHAHNYGSQNISFGYGPRDVGSIDGERRFRKIN